MQCMQHIKLNIDIIHECRLEGYVYFDSVYLFCTLLICIEFILLSFFGKVPIDTVYNNICMNCIIM